MIDPSDVALLHQLTAAAEPGAQLPKHVAAQLERQGLVALGNHSPGEVTLTDSGRQRLRELLEHRDEDE